MTAETGLADLKTRNKHTVKQTLRRKSSDGSECGSWQRIDSEWNPK